MPDRSWIVLAAAGAALLGSGLIVAPGGYSLPWDLAAFADDRPAAPPSEPAVFQPPAKPAEPKSNEAKGPEAKAPEPKPLEAKSPEAKPLEAKPAGTSAVVLDLNAVRGLMGRAVKSSAGEDMGHVVDLLVAPDGKIRAVILDFGGVLGVGSRKVAVDWKALSFADLGKDGPVQVLLTRNQIRVAPEYKANDAVVVLEASPEPSGKGEAPGKSEPERSGPPPQAAAPTTPPPPATANAPAATPKAAAPEQPTK